MRLAIDVEQLRGVHVRVALRRRQLHVPEQLLDRAQVGASLEQVRGEGVSQRVRADAESRAARRDVARDETLHASPGEAGAAEVEEERLSALGSRLTALGSRLGLSLVLRSSAAPRAPSATRAATVSVAELNGTSRSLAPLPITRTIRARRFTSSRSSPTSSLSRRPEA